MKLSQRSIQILRNFSTINPSIQFTEGTQLRTISPSKTVMAIAKLEDEVEQTFAVYDLSRLLGVISLLEDPTYELKEKMMTIKTKNCKVNYAYADVSTIVVPPNKELNIGDPDVQFTLKESQLNEVMKALGIMSLPELVIAGENGNIVLRATDSKSAGSDQYDIVVGETKLEFSAVFKTENLKLIAGDYDVSISKKGISYFKGKDVEYWISIETNSSF